MNTRQSQCLEALKVLGRATAREVAKYLFDNGYTNIEERNIAHPRLNELVEMEKVKIVGKKLDELTKKEVSIYEKM